MLLTSLFFKKSLTNYSVYDKILWYCGATGYTVRLGQSEPCKIYQTLCGYGGIGRREWFRLRYDSVKISVSLLCETFFIDLSSQLYWGILKLIKTAVSYRYSSSLFIRHKSNISNRSSLHRSAVSHCDRCILGTARSHFCNNTTSAISNEPSPFTSPLI